MLRVRIELLSHIGVRVQVLLKLRMIAQVVLSLGKGRIPLELFGDFRMPIEELTKAAVRVSIAVVTVHIVVATIKIPATIIEIVVGAVIAGLVLTRVVTIFLMHEGIWIVLQFFPNFRVSLKEALDLRMIFQELWVVCE